MATISAATLVGAAAVARPSHAQGKLVVWRSGARASGGVHKLEQCRGISPHMRTEEVAVCHCRAATAKGESREGAVRRRRLEAAELAGRQQR